MPQSRFALSSIRMSQAASRLATFRAMAYTSQRHLGEATMKRLDRWRLLIERSGDMNVDAIVYASKEIRIEEDSLEQLRNAARLPSVQRVLATPDIHVGYGVPIGCVAAVTDIIVPAAVGYDVNCGMRIMTTPLEAKDVDVKKLADSIRRDIPLGEGKDNLRLSYDDLDVILARGVRGIAEIAGEEGRVWQARNPEEEAEDLERIEENGSMPADPAAVSDRAKERGRSQLCTLGGGNHFIEIQVVDRILDQKLASRLGLAQGMITAMVHSGSRGLGHQVGDDYMRRAKSITRDISLHDLHYLPLANEEGQRYVKAMYAAANFAFVNRQFMGSIVRRNFRHFHGDIAMPLIYDVPHNMAKLEEHFGRQVWVHRKGATRAFGPSRMQGTAYADCGQPVLIPGSMGTASYVLMGHDSPEAAEALYSVNHGAGRQMSRSAAVGKVTRKGQVIREPEISDEEFRRSMDGVYLISEDRRSAKEEAPGAYKDIDVVVETVLEAGLARGVARLRPLAVLKG